MKKSLHGKRQLMFEKKIAVKNVHYAKNLDKDDGWKIEIRNEMNNRLKAANMHQDNKCSTSASAATIRTILSCNKLKLNSAIAKK